MKLGHTLDRLVDALKHLPGIGPRSAQRIAFHLLQHDRDAALRLGESLLLAARTIGHCQRCNTLTEDAICAMCNSARRDPQTLCVVESPADVAAIEQSGSYRGTYFVLMGHLSPLDGIGPDELGFVRSTPRRVTASVSLPDRPQASSRRTT